MTQDSGSGSRNGVRKKPRRGAGYPDRNPFFFHRFVRLLIKTCAAMVIGADGCFLCTVIAATEDSARYRYAVRFFNTQLAQLCGWSVDKLDGVRQRCIDEGFLHYERGGNRTPGLYWVLVDGSLADAPEVGPIGELDSDFKPQSTEHPADNLPTEPRETGGETPEESTELTSLVLSNSSPPPPANPMAEPTGKTDSVVAVEEILREVGLAAAVQTASEVIARDYSVDQVQELAEELKRRPNLGPGALVFRIRNVPPGEPVSDGWPEPPSAKPLVDERSREAERLNRHYKADLDRMSANQVIDLAERAGIDDARNRITTRGRGILIPDELTRVLGELARDNDALSANRDRRVSVGAVAAAVPQTQTQHDRRPREPRTEAV